jgi:RimJ/RimL family protein N-acetyltransferase
MTFSGNAIEVPTEIKTDRLLLRCPRPGDGAVVHASVLESLSALREFPASLPWAMEDPSVERSERFCGNGATSYVKRTDMPMLVFLKGTDVHVGNIGLHDFEWQVPKCEIGFWGRSSYGGRGFMTEAVRALTAFGLSRLALRRIEALPDESNLRSRSVCERVGYLLEGTMRNDLAWSDGVLRHTCIYAVVR